MIGQDVCGSHGGRSPQAKKKASERLAAAADAAAAKLIHIMYNSADESVVIRAAQMILDRTGHHPSQTVELTGPDGEALEARFTLNMFSLETRRMMLRDMKAADVDPKEAVALLKKGGPSSQKQLS